MLFSLQNTTQTLLSPQTVMLPFVQYSNLVKGMDNMNAIKGSQNERCSAWERIFWVIHLRATVSSLKPLSQIYSSSGWVFYCTTHSGCSTPLSSDPSKTSSEYPV